jgi:hypothetical protein
MTGWLGQIGGNDPVNLIDPTGWSSSNAALCLAYKYLKKANNDPKEAWNLALQDRIRSFHIEYGDLDLRDAEHFLWNNYTVNGDDTRAIAQVPITMGYSLVKLLVTTFGSEPTLGELL